LNLKSIVQPGLTVLTREQKDLVHRSSLQILAEVGIRVDSLKALKVFSSSKRVKINDNLVLIEPELIDWAIARVPRIIDIYKRDGSLSFYLGKDSTRFGIGTTNLFYLEPGTDDVIPFTRDHMKLGTRLANSLENYDLVSPIGILKDVHPARQDLIGTLEMAANTCKPLVLLVSDPSQFTPSLDLMENLFKDLVTKPFLIPYFNPVTPLVINRDTGDKMIETISRGLPFIFSNYSMVGTTSPITPAGTLSLLNAELLAGLVLTQIAKEGASIILGSLPAFFDMKSMVDYYDPLTILLNEAIAEMMEFYQIPHAGTSGSGNGWGMDIPASGMLWLNHLIACIGKTGLAPFVGGSLGSKVFSPETVVYADEIITQLRRFTNGFIFDDESIGMDTISKIGPGGNFLFSKTTSQKYKENLWESQLFPNISLEKWQDLGKPKASEKLKDRTIKLIYEAHAPEDNQEILRKGEEFISKIL